MIEQVLKNVRIAEAEAEKRVAQATEKAEQIRSSAILSVREIEENAKRQAKLKVKDILDAAKEKARQNSDKKARQTQVECEKLVADLTKKADDYAQIIFGRIISGSC